jgi:hypothetical protein
VTETAYRFDELGSLQFERLCLALLEEPLGVSTAEWRETLAGCAVLLPGGVEALGLPGPTVAVLVWQTDTDAPRDRLRSAVQRGLEEWPAIEPRSMLVLTNSTSELHLAGPEIRTLGPAELTRLVDRSWSVRLALPSVLGIGPADRLEPGESTLDLGAARELARVFVPTRPYAAALDVLLAHRFVVLTGPPEMGKTAIARMIGLAAMTGGWEAHECIRPEELWARFRRDRPQVFVADDAFGSTEYRPEAAERWALELDRVLRAMDEKHWLVWTSRPAPLKAGLMRIHREHGVERFPQPAEVQVDASGLDVSEKALILFRHAKAAAPPAQAVELVRAEGWTIVRDPHFTPERIRRFVGGRLVELGEEVGSRHEIRELVAAELREPTEAMAASFRALSEEDRRILLALLDTPPGPVGERRLVAAYRRHEGPGLSRHPHELVDRLTDHFVRVAEGGVTWVHPSWRDLVIDELAADPAARRDFLHRACLDGLLLALSTGGGAAGARRLPLLRDDPDWDALSDRLAELVPGLDEPGVARLLLALAEARPAETPANGRELVALDRYALELVARRWDHDRAVIPVGLLAAWFGLAARLDEPPAPPGLAPTWIELLPGEGLDPTSSVELARLDDWTALAEVLSVHAPDLLAAFGFPERQQEAVAAFAAAVIAKSGAAEPAQREAWRRVAQRLLRMLGSPLLYGAIRALDLYEEPEWPETYTPRELSPELRRILDAPPSRRASDYALVARVLRDL